MNGWVRLALAVLVSLVWGASYLVSIINHNYHPPPELNGLMMLVAGFFFASGLKGNGNGKGRK